MQSTLKTLKARAKNFQEREKRMTRITMLKQRKVLKVFKKFFILIFFVQNYEESRSKLSNEMKELDDKKKDVDEARSQRKPIERKIAKTEADMKKLQQNVAKTVNFNFLLIFNWFLFRD